MLTGLCVHSAWKQSVNPLYWRLISEFKRMTGVPALLNTSLNIKGEPMICDAPEAIRCFYDSGMDYLALGLVPARQAGRGLKGHRPVHGPSSFGAQNAAMSGLRSFFSSVNSPTS